jgi:hypothetical protein
LNFFLKLLKALEKCQPQSLEQNIWILNFYSNFNDKKKSKFNSSHILGVKVSSSLSLGDIFFPLKSIPKVCLDIFVREDEKIEYFP